MILRGRALQTCQPSDPELAILCSFIRYVCWNVFWTIFIKRSTVNFEVVNLSQGSRKLYIFAGQRGKEYLSDFVTYEIDTNHIEHINFNDSSSSDSNHVPAAGFTHRATIDSELGEIYVLSVRSKYFWLTRITIQILQLGLQLIFSVFSVLFSRDWARTRINETITCKILSGFTISKITNGHVFIDTRM